MLRKRLFFSAPRPHPPTHRALLPAGQATPLFACRLRPSVLLALPRAGHVQRVAPRWR